MDFINALAGILGVAVLVAGGLLGLQMGALRTLRSSNADLRDRVSDLESKDQVREVKMAEIQADRDALARVVTGEAHWVALGEQLETHHQEATRWWVGATEALSDIRDALTGDEV